MMFNVRVRNALAAFLLLLALDVRLNWKWALLNSITNYVETVYYYFFVIV